MIVEVYIFKKMHQLTQKDITNYKLRKKLNLNMNGNHLKFKMKLPYFEPEKPCEPPILYNVLL